MLESILSHVSRIGWDNTCWSDDNLASKKIYPIFQFPAKSPRWQARVKTTPESMAMMAQRVQSKQEALPMHLRKKKEVAERSRESVAKRHSQGR